MDQFAGADALSDVLAHLHIKATVYCRSDLRAPWAFRVDRKDSASFHALTRGRASLEVKGVDGAITLKPGDLVLIPHGNGHVLRHSSKAKPIALDELIAQNPLEDGIRLKMSGRGARTTVLCGSFQFDGSEINPLVASLPPVIHIRGERKRGSLLQMTLRRIDLETQNSMPGARTLIARLSDVLFLQAVRTYFARLSKDGQGEGWIRALKDPQIGRAITLIHRNPESPWSVALLASEVAMSRSSFSARFKSMVGESPLKYVARWRVLKAAWLLQNSNAKLTEVARTVGYNSDIALNKVFKRLLKTAPGAYRRIQTRSK